MHKYNCEICGAEIHSTGKKRVLKCKACLKRERSKRERQETSSPCYFVTFSSSSCSSGLKRT